MRPDDPARAGRARAARAAAPSSAAALVACGAASCALPEAVHDGAGGAGAGSTSVTVSGGGGQGGSGAAASAVSSAGSGGGRCDPNQPGAWPDSDFNCADRVCPAGADGEDTDAAPMHEGGDPIKDLVTKLSWAIGPEGQNHAGAGAACADMGARLPSLVELTSLFDYADAGDRLFDDFGDGAAVHWAAEPHPKAGNWAVRFDAGWVGGWVTGGDTKTLCVTHGCVAAPNLGAEVDGILLDPRTGLRWNAGPTSATSWSDALTACAPPSRLPNAKELLTIFVASDSGSHLAAGFVPSAETNIYWSSTPDVANPGQAIAVAFDAGDFFFGFASAPVDMGQLHAVRCVQQ